MDKRSKPKVVESTQLANAPYIKLKKGFDILIKGSPQKEISDYKATTFSINPKDFNGISPIPKVDVVVGDEVKAGDILFYDKKNPDVKYTAPVGGEVVEINRGAKRSIEDIVILADSSDSFKSFDVSGFESFSRADIVSHMLEAGLWPFLKQRPFNSLANFNEVPEGIYISSFDTSPMAVDYNVSLHGEDRNFQAGIDALSKLTDGSVHLSLKADGLPDSTFVNAKNVNHYWFEGKHPAGNVGIQIHHIKPIVKGDIVWTIGPEDVVTIGKYFLEGKFEPVRTVALGGPDVKKPQYFKTKLGASIAGMLKDNLNNEHVRVISGNVLTGKTIELEKGYLRFYDNQVSVIEEGDKYELFGWMAPHYMRPSLSRTLPAAYLKSYKHNVNTNTHGEHRAFVETGQYEQVLPMDLYPVHLIKSILANDLDKMEGLGIYEVVEEDLAICEFVCTSKQDVQQILRDGIEYLKEQI
ncbi:MAG: Na(+)-translocating NADH-quinone reductase subunit A [Bacteroidetes bacterium]|nr:Na(+)-translocating NADH-quinone reductase subunit A [Bacteroidota bacterium]